MRFRAALPQVRVWIENLLQTYADSAKKIQISFFPGIAKAYPADLVERARIVSVDRTPFPPVSKFGLPEFARYEGMRFDGITFMNTMFVVKGRELPSLIFHELVHVVQWDRLGADQFLLAYGLGLAQFGYEQSPLEQMAYLLERQYKGGALPPDLMRVIQDGSDTIWSEVARAVGA